MILEVLRSLHEYSDWANRRVLDTAEQLTSYTTTEGYPRSDPLWRPMFHQLNHSTAHRSEAAVMLTNFGHSPGDLDYVVYLAEMGEGVRP